jgi:hypothetical protein
LRQLAAVAAEPLGHLARQGAAVMLAGMALAAVVAVAVLPVAVAALVATG